MDKQTATVLGLLAVAALVLAPMVSAAPINPFLGWSPISIPVGASTTATAGVAIDADCPSGGTYSGTITVTEPDGVSVATYSVSGIACGTYITASYPSAFTGKAGTTEVGTYTTSWVGTTTASATFDLTDSVFTVSLPPSVPQFGAPAMPGMLVAALGLALVVAMRKGRLLKI